MSRLRFHKIFTIYILRISFVPLRMNDIFTRFYFRECTYHFLSPFQCGRCMFIYCIFFVKFDDNWSHFQQSFSLKSIRDLNINLNSQIRTKKKLHDYEFWKCWRKSYSFYFIPDPIKSSFTINQSNLYLKTKKYKMLFHLNPHF